MAVAAAVLEDGGYLAFSDAAVKLVQRADARAPEHLPTCGSGSS